MGGMIDRVEGRAGEASAEVVRRLEAGQAPSAVASDLGLSAVDLVAAIARAGLGGAGSEGPGLVQSRPSHPRLAGALADDSMAGLLPGSARPARRALAAGLLQALDHWDASHAAAQEADDLGDRDTSAYWHGIAHRREPDAGNALYWARRVGRHPIFEDLAGAARPLLDAHGDPSLSARLVDRGAWSPSAMIDLATRPRLDPSTAALARRLQRLEMLLLLDATVDGLGLRVP